MPNHITNSKYMIIYVNPESSFYVPSGWRRIRGLAKLRSSLTVALYYELPCSLGIFFPGVASAAAKPRDPTCGGVTFPLNGVPGGVAVVTCEMLMFAPGPFQTMIVNGLLY